MDKIYVISEDCHGEIIYASSREKAIEALIATDWINGCCEFWDGEKEEGFYLEDLYPNWKEWLRNMATDKDFEDLGFYIHQKNFYK